MRVYDIFNIKCSLHEDKFEMSLINKIFTLSNYEFQIIYISGRKDHMKPVYTYYFYNNYIYKLFC